MRSFETCLAIRARRHTRARSTARHIRAIQPTPVAAPRLIAWSREVAELVGFSPDDVASPLFAEVFGGNALLDGMEPYAANYGGHQFGHWAGQLGDGRAITLGEVLNASGQRWELQLKGAGPTPYARRADGRAVLRSSIREFLCSEAMHHLGVPTTRALSLVLTGDQVLRDMFYDGDREARAGRHRLPRRAVVHPVRQFSAAGVARRLAAARAARRFHDPPRLPRAVSPAAATARARTCAPSGSRRSASAPPRWSRAGCGSGSSTA